MNQFKKLSTMKNYCIIELSFHKISQSPNIYRFI